MNGSWTRGQFTWETGRGANDLFGCQDEDEVKPRHGNEKQRDAQDNSVWSCLTDFDRALWRSQRGPLASVAFTTFPSSVCRIEASGFVCCLSTAYVRFLDVFGQHRAACAEAKVLGRRGHVLSSPGTGRTCLERHCSRHRYLTGCPSSEAHNLQSTQLWFVPPEEAQRWACAIVRRDGRVFLRDGPHRR